MQPNTLQSHVKVLVKAREKYFDIRKTKNIRIVHDRP